MLPPNKLIVYGLLPEGNHRQDFSPFRLHFQLCPANVGYEG